MQSLQLPIRISVLEVATGCVKNLSTDSLLRCILFLGKI